jgi:hypothetical protein
MKMRIAEERNKEEKRVMDAVRPVVDRRYYNGAGILNSP